MIDLVEANVNQVILCSRRILDIPLMSESAQDLSYYREFLQDFSPARIILTPPTIPAYAYRESNADLTYYRTYLERS